MGTTSDTKPYILNFDQEIDKGGHMTRVGVVGATGYTGAELVRILSGHPDVELTILTSRQHGGVSIDSVIKGRFDCARLNHCRLKVRGERCGPVAFGYRFIQ